MRCVTLPRGIFQWRLPTHPAHVFRRPKSKLSKLSKLGRNAAGVELPSTPARTRFAPSPTGWVHIGGLRTALYNYLLAKKTGGQFILRIEDTDQTRLVPGAEQRIYEDLQWAGLLWDEGPDGVGGKHGPYKQSERLETYKRHAQELVDNDKAFRCFCKPEALEALKKQSMENNVPMSYPGTCHHIHPDESARRAANGEEHCIRFRAGASPSFVDLVYGGQTKSEKEDDFILMKRDGFPTYHFANVVDDHLMEITHVIRGVEWLVSTPRHISLYDAFDWKPPQFAHVGLLMNQKNQKLSKRHGLGGVESWRDMGYLPEALINYIMLLGWGEARKAAYHSEVMDLSEMVEKFSLKFTRGNTVINDKDIFFQGEHSQRIKEKFGADQLAERFLPSLQSEIGAWKAGWHHDHPNTTRLEYARSSIDELHLGDIVPDAQPKAGQEAEGVHLDPDYARKLIFFDDAAPFLAPRFLKRQAYLVWGVPKKALEARMDMLMSEGKLTPVIFKGDTVPFTEEEMVEAEKPVSDEELFGEKNSPWHGKSSLVEVLQMFTTLLERIKPEDWDAESIKAALGQPARYTWGYVDSDEDKVKKNWGWQVVRWLVMAGQTGPAVFPCMALLGKDETMRRFQQALEFAEEWEAGRPQPDQTIELP